MCLIAASDWAEYGKVALAIAMTIFGLGFVIFVHELGHFLVAKMCGVRCDRFFLGFDVPLGRGINYLLGREGEFSLFGLKIPRTIGRPVKIGETTYGIGILPLGGYVGMLGQNDDPRMSEEQIRESQQNDGSDPMKEIIGPGGEPIMVNARSYIAKSVPQRMAIISAGVIMNVIFAFIFAFIAFGIGVPSLPCVLGGTDPGGPAWEYGLRADDKVVRIDDIEDPWFQQLQTEVTLSGTGESVAFEVKRPGVEETFVIDMRPSRERLKIAQVGAFSPRSLVLPDKDPTPKFSPAHTVADQIPNGGRIVAVDGTEITRYGQLEAFLATNASKPLEVTFETKGEEPGTYGPRTTVTLPPNPREYVGLVMKMGPIEAVQNDSPAAQAGLKPGDQIVAINDTPIGMTEDGQVGWNPATLGSDLSQLASSGETLALTVVRPAEEEGKKPERLTFNVVPREVDWIESPFSARSPTSAPALGIAYFLENVVEGVLPDSPAAAAGLKRGDRIASVRFIVPEEHRKAFPVSEEPIELNAKQQAWASILEEIQDVPPGTQLELEVVRAGAKEPEKLELAVATDAESFDPHRGIKLEPILEIRQGDTIGAQLSMASYETGRALTSVYRFLHRIFSGDIPPGALGGPITIARASYLTAMEGFPRLLLFLTLISANLAVVNFLPIPILDGGHMAFLAYEGIVRKPANEMIAGILNLAGLGLIVCLMIFVFGLDLGFIDRNL